MARKLLSAHSGRGIVIMETEDDFVDAPLYTKYFKKAREFRVHVMQGDVIDIQEKKKRSSLDSEEVDYRVRNHAGGFVFCRQLIDVPEEVLQQAQAAVKCLGLDFGAVDVGFNEQQGKACVFEVNTSPALVGKTIEIYSREIKKRWAL